MLFHSITVYCFFSVNGFKETVQNYERKNYIKFSWLMHFRIHFCSACRTWMIYHKEKIERKRRENRTAINMKTNQQGKVQHNSDFAVTRLNVLIYDNIDYAITNSQRPKIISAFSTKSRFHKYNTWNWNGILVFNIFLKRVNDWTCQEHMVMICYLISLWHFCEGI